MQSSRGSSGLIVISSPNQQVFGEQLCLLGRTRSVVLQWENEGMEVSSHRGQKKRAAPQAEQRMRDESCCGDVEEEAEEGEEERARGLMGRWTRCSLRRSRSHLCGTSSGSRRPLSCAWSRSLAGGRVGGG